MMVLNLLACRRKLPQQVGLFLLSMMLGMLEKLQLTQKLLV
jgi:hypothetical protein